MPSDQEQGQKGRKKGTQTTGSDISFTNQRHSFQNENEEESLQSVHVPLLGRLHSGSDKYIQIFTEDSDDESESSSSSSPTPEINRHDSFTYTISSLLPPAPPAQHQSQLPSPPSVSLLHPPTSTNVISHHQHDPRLHSHFRLMADEIIDCYTPEENRQINRNDYVQVNGRRFLTWSGTLIVSGYLLLMFGSAFLFTYVEHVNKESKDLHDLQYKFFSDYPNVDEEQLLALIKTAIHAQKSGINVEDEFRYNLDVIRNGTGTSIDDVNDQIDDLGQMRSRRAAIEERQQLSPSSIDGRSQNIRNLNAIINKKSHNWNFKQSLLFVVSVATTIGYGNIVPETGFGKLLTLIFGMVAIPSTTLLASLLVAKFCNGPLRRFQLSLLTRHFDRKDNRTLRTIRMISLVLITAFIFAFILFLPSFGFLTMEPGWTLLDSFYFCFISITTTGLGDLVPEYEDNLFHWIFELVTILYLYVGIFCIMLWMTQIKSCFRKSLTLKLDEIEEDDTANEGMLEEQCLLYYYHQKNYINYGSFYGYDDITVKIPQRTHQRTHHLNRHPDHGERI